jgi:osmotically-inducible protein OsmY
MKTFVFALTLLLAVVVVAQQPSAYPSSSPTQQPAQQTPSQSQMPAAGDSSAVESQIQQAWQQQSDLSGAKLNAHVSGGTVTLSGTVSSEDQHQKAVAAATQAAGGMKVVDKIKVQAK